MASLGDALRHRGEGEGEGEGGGRMKPLVVLLMQLFSACMDPAVPPHDALLSIQGPLAVNSARQLFSLGWFRSYRSYLCVLCCVF